MTTSTLETAKWRDALGDPPRKERPVQDPNEVRVEWLPPVSRSRGGAFVVVTAEGAIRISKSARELMGAQPKQPFFVRIGLVRERAMLIIEPIDGRDPLARKVIASSGEVGGGAIAFPAGKYPVDVDRANKRIAIAARDAKR